MLREMNNYTQQYVAGELELSQNAYSLLEKGQTKLTLDRLDQIAAFYNISTVELLSERDASAPVPLAHSNMPPPISSMEKLLYERTIRHFESNITRLYSLIEKLASTASSSADAPKVNAES